MSMIETMTALVKEAPGPGHVALVSRSKPGVEHGHVILEVEAAGVCGTDLHILRDEYKSTPPVTLGHEVAGLVVDTGPGVDQSWLGTRVACETFFSTCGSCAYCRGGRPNLCAERRSIGSGVDGGFARWMAIPAKNLHRVPDSLPSPAAALAEPLACVCNCMFDPSCVSAGDKVVVTGPGPVGLLAAQIAALGGADVLVIGTDHDSVRLAAAAKLGLKTAYTEDPHAIQRHCGDDGADAGIECSGNGAAIKLLLEHTKRRGRYVQIGLFGRPITVPFDLICFREISVSSGFASTPQSWRRAMTLIEDGSIKLEPLITEVCRLDEWSRVFESMASGQGVKFVFDPRQSGSTGAGLK